MLQFVSFPEYTEFSESSAHLWKTPLNYLKILNFSQTYNTPLPNQFEAKVCGRSVRVSECAGDVFCRFIYFTEILLIIATFNPPAVLVPSNLWTRVSAGLLSLDGPRLSAQSSRKPLSEKPHMLLVQFG